MTSTPQIQKAARWRRRTIALVGSAATLALAAVLVTMLPAGSSGQPQGTVSAPGPGGGTGSEGGPVPRHPPRAQPGWVVLPGPGGQEAGFPVRFPHTPQGAAAAMAAMLKSSWTLDEVQARRASAIYAQPRSRDEAVEGGADSTRDFRTDLGLPLTGDVPQAPT